MSVDRSWYKSIVEIERRETYGAHLPEFERHKKLLLDILRKVHADGPKSEPFDEDEAWRGLVRAAVWYFKRTIIKEKIVLPGRSVERLRDLAKSLGRARDMAVRLCTMKLALIYSGDGAPKPIYPRVRRGGLTMTATPLRLTRLRQQWNA